MTSQEIKAYLKDAYELESQVYTYQRILNLYENHIKELNASMNELANKEDDASIKKIIPDYEKDDYIKSPQYYKEEMTYHPNSDCSQLLFDMVWQLPDSAEKEKLYKKLKGKNFFSREFEGKMRLSIIIFTILLAILTHKLILPIIIGLVSYFILLYLVLEIFTGKISYNSNICQEIIKKYSNWYTTELEKQNTSIQLKIEKLSKMKTEEVIAKLQETESLLRKFYSKDIIHPKYRNLIAISQIYEYFDTGRCTELEGPSGAYNLFESELRQHIIITKLDIIIEKLDELTSAMYYVASAINRSNSILSNVSSQLGQISASLSLIESNTALTAYNTQCTAFNTELMRRYY